MQEKAKLIVSEWFGRNGIPVEYGDVYVVWFCKTLQNWKAILSAHEPHQYLFEVSYNGDKGETYVDVYDKKENYTVK